MNLKNNRQIEFAELKDKLGWEPSDIVRALGISKASVSKILSGEQSPRPQLLELFRRIVAERLGRQREIAEVNRRFPPTEPLVVRDAERREVRGKLDRLADSNPAVYRSISVLIDGFTAQPRASSAEVVAQGEPSELDVAGVPRPPAAPAPKPATAAPSAHKRAPAAPARTRASAPPASPKPVPSAPEA